VSTYFYVDTSESIGQAALGKVDDAGDASDGLSFRKKHTGSSSY
jgi:hypothetical protein